MHDKVAPLDEEERPKKMISGVQRLLLYLCYILTCILCYWGIMSLYRSDFSFRVEDFFVLIGAWSFLSVLAGILLYPGAKLKAAGLGVLVMLASLLLLNLLFILLPFEETNFMALQAFILTGYFLFFIIISELMFRWMTK